MDTHVAHSREGEDEDHHEKKSVLKKVKAKAKKLKDTITGHGGHEQQEGHHHDMYDEDDDEEEVEDPEVQGAPIYDSEVRRTPAHREADILPMVNFGDTKAGRDEFDPIVPSEQRSNLSRSKLAGPTTHEPHSTPISSLPYGHYNPTTMDVDDDPVRTSVFGQGARVSEARGMLGKTDVLGEGTPLPHSSNDGIDPRQTFVSSKGGHLDHSKVNLDLPRGGLEEDPHAPKSNPQAYTPSNYETKVTDPIKSGGAEIGITPILRSFDKMKLHSDGANQNMPSTGSHDQFSTDKPSNQSSSYISSATSAIADKAISAKNAVASKLGYGTTQPVEQHDYSRGYVTGPTKSGSSSPREHHNKVLDPSTNQLKPSEPPQVRGAILPDRNTEHDLQQSNQSGGGTYTEKLSSATSAIADKAISAKNVVASKLGYGASDGQAGHENVAHDHATNVQPESAASDQHGKTITYTVTENLTPVYEKVALAGSAVMSKFQGGSATGAREANADQAMQDKGVSLKDYFVEKLRPGEEDRALSEVISEKLQIHKSTMGKVTESDQVRQSLGNTKNDNYVVERVKASVGSMLGGANKNDEGLSSSAAAAGDKERRGVCVVDHRRLQEN